MLTDGVGHLHQPGAILGEFEQIHSRKELDAIGLRIAQGLEQARRDDNGNIMRLTIQHPRRLFRRQARRQPPQKP